MTLADELATEALAIRRDVQRIDAVSRTRPHVFAEQKDELARRLDKLAIRLRNAFGGTPARVNTGRTGIAGRAGTIAGPNGRRIRVERRRARA